MTAFLAARAVNAVLYTLEIIPLVATSESLYELHLVTGSFELLKEIANSVIKKKQV